MSMIKAIHVNQIDPDRPSTYYELNDYSFLIRRNIREIADLLFKKVIEQLRHPPHNESSSNSILDDKEKIGRYNSDSIEGAFMMTFQKTNMIILVICRDNTNDRMVKELMRDIYRSSDPSSNLESLTKKWEAEYDGKLNKISKIQEDVDEVTAIMKESIEKMIARGETLESLVKKTDELSISSKVFIERSKKLNRCCLLL